MLTFLRVLSLQRCKMSSGLGRGGMTGASFFCSVSDPVSDPSGMLSVGDHRSFSIHPSELSYFIWQRWKALGCVPWFILSLSGDLALFLTFLLGEARRLFFCWRYLRLFRRYVSWLRRCRVLLWMLLAFLMVDLRTPHRVEWQPADVLIFKC